MLLRRSSSGAARLGTPNSEPSKGLLRRSDSGGLRAGSGRPLTARQGATAAVSGSSTPRGSPTTSRCIYVCVCVCVWPNMACQKRVVLAVKQSSLIGDSLETPLSLSCILLV